MNCCVDPATIDGFAGVTTIDCNVAAVTVNVVDPFTDPDVAVICDDPAATPVASPCVPAVLLMVAKFVFAELHVTDVVRSCVLLSLNVPVAVNC